MKSWIVAGFLFSLGGLAASQADPVVAQTADVDAKRAKIAAERNSLEAQFLSEDAACYKKFAVNHCLDNVNARRMEAMAALRREEILLNDHERKTKAEQQIRRTQEKSSPESLQQESERRAKALEDFRNRQERERENIHRKNAAGATEAAARESSAARLQAHQQKNQARTEKEARAAEEAQKFSERQAKARERRDRHEAEQAARGKSSAKPLPVPP